MAAKFQERFKDRRNVKAGGVVPDKGSIADLRGVHKNEECNY